MGSGMDPGALPGAPGQPEERGSSVEDSSRGPRGRVRPAQRLTETSPPRPAGPLAQNGILRLGTAPSGVGTEGDRPGSSPSRCSSLSEGSSPWARRRRLPHPGQTEVPGRNRATSGRPGVLSSEQSWAPGPTRGGQRRSREVFLKRRTGWGAGAVVAELPQQGPALTLTVSLGGAPSPKWGGVR